PLLEELRDVTGETAALFRLEEDRSICILECESRHVLSISRGIGSTMRFPQGATGKAMLAFMSPERQMEFISSMPRDSQRANWEETLRTAAHNGYTISRGEIFVWRGSRGGALFRSPGSRCWVGRRLRPRRARQRRENCRIRQARTSDRSQDFDIAR